VAGTAGAAFTVIEELDEEIHVGDAVNLALTVWFPAATPVKVVLA